MEKEKARYKTKKERDEGTKSEEISEKMKQMCGEMPCFFDCVFLAYVLTPIVDYIIIMTRNQRDKESETKGKQKEQQSV